MGWRAKVVQARWPVTTPGSLDLKAFSLQHLDQRRPVEPEQLRGPILIATGLLEGLGDELIFVLLDGRAKIDATLGQGLALGATLLGRGGGCLPNSVRKVGCRDDRTRCEKHRSLDGVLQRTHVAGPRVGPKRIEGVGCKGNDVSSPGPLRARLEKMECQHFDVVAAVTQSWQIDRNYVE